MLASAEYAEAYHRYAKKVGDSCYNVGQRFPNCGSG